MCFTACKGVLLTQVNVSGDSFESKLMGEPNSPDVAAGSEGLGKALQA